MADATWRIDAGVARDLAGALGWTGDDGPAALAERFPQRVPVGSTAKLAAIEAGLVPPGDDPEALARRILDHWIRVAQAPAGGATSPSWSCWVVATVMAALIDHAGLGPVRVVATRRTDEGAPVVDLHAAVTVEVDGRTWVCDPYFGIGLSAPLEPGSSIEAVEGPCRARLDHDPDHGWGLGIRLAHWTGDLRYRVFGPALDRGDVRAVAAISVHHTGVPNRPYGRLHVGGQVVDVRTGDDGRGIVARWPAVVSEHAIDGAAGGWSDPGPTGTFPTWADAVDTFAVWTGTRIS